MSVNIYQYRKLSRSNTIRVIELAPARISRKLYGRIFDISFDSTGTYNALSYIWGNPQMTRVFETAEGSLSITESLFSALTRLRYQDKPRVVWADGICINQACEEDKVQQVMLMDKIYSKASNTIVDLGAASENRSWSPHC